MPKIFLPNKVLALSVDLTSDAQAVENTIDQVNISNCTKSVLPSEKCEWFVGDRWALYCTNYYQQYTVRCWWRLCCD